MTTQHQIIAICIIFFIAVPLGTFTTIKCIKKLTRVPENTLYRRNDIELVDYIVPSQPVNAYHPLDNFEYPTHVNIPSYPPSYRTVEIINSSLENSINIEFISLIFIFICFLILWKIKKYLLKGFLMIQLVKISTEIIILWIVLAIFIMNSLNFYNSVYSISILIPFSFFEIDFRDSFDWKKKKKNQFISS